MRCSKMPDQAVALESLVNVFISKKTWATGQFSFRPFDSHLQVLTLLFALQGDLKSAKVTEVSWKLLKFLQKTQSQHLRLAPQPDLFMQIDPGTTIQSIKGPKDYFFLDKGQIFDDFSRFGEFLPRFPKFSESEAVFFQSQQFEQAGTWFDSKAGDLMGAFLHLQMQDSRNPFNISLKLPPLEAKKTGQGAGVDFPFPCIPKEAPALAEARTQEKIDWQVLTQEYEKNSNFCKFDPSGKKQAKMWENHEKKPRFAKSLKDLSKLYEKSLKLKLDDQFLPSIRPLAVKDLIRSLKLLILGIPNPLFDKDYKPKSRFRLEALSHSSVLNILQKILQFSKSYKFLSLLSVELQKKEELVSPSLSRGIKNVLSFIEHFIIRVPDDLSLIQFLVQTQSLREQVESLRTVCAKLPSGFAIIDYIYLILTRNEGDFENYHLLQKLFKNIVRPVLDALTCFSFTSEVNDVYGEFFIQQDHNFDVFPDFSLEKYFKGFKSSNSQLFASVVDPLLEIGRNLKMMKTLDKDLSCYFQVLSSGCCSSLDPLQPTVPAFRLSYKNKKISRISDDFLAFYAEQTRSLLSLEKKLADDEQEIIQKANLAKLKKIQQVRLFSEAQQKAEVEKVLEKHRKQWNFAQVLENQLKENQELRRIEREKRLDEEKRMEERLEQEKRELIEKGRAFLMEQHENLALELYRKNAVENWKKNRSALNEKRLIWFREREEAERKEIEARMQVDLIEPILGYSEEAPEILMQIDEPSEVIQEANKTKEVPNPQEVKEEHLKKSNFTHKSETLPPEPFRAVRQPPGGFSTIQSLFNDQISPVVSKPDISQMPRIGYNESLEKWEICSSLLYEEVIKKVFRKISPVKQWELQAKPEDSDMFQDLFPDFQAKKTQDQNHFIPFNKVVEKLIVQPIQAQAEIVNKACLHLFIRKLRLVDHLKALKRYALLEAGDTIDLFLTTIFSPGFSGNLTAVWEGCLKMTSSKDDEFGDLIKISMKKTNLYRMQFKTVEDLEFLQLGFNIKGPLELIFNQDRLEEYSKAFVSLLRVKYVTSILSNIKTFNVPMNHLYYRKIHFLRQKMQHFIDIYHGYVASELHGAAWRTLVSDVLKAQNLADIAKVHAKYLDTIQNRCFLKESGTRVMDQLKMIFQLVMRFRNIVVELDEFSLREIEAIEDDFNSIHRFLFKMTQKMALNGFFPELFVRLDFNEFMTRKIERERVL